MSPRVKLHSLPLVLQTVQGPKVQALGAGHLVLSPSPAPPQQCDKGRGVTALLPVVLRAKAMTVHRGGHGTTCDKVSTCGYLVT